MSIIDTISKAGRVAGAAAELDIPSTVGAFEAMLDDIKAATETAATAAVAALVAEHGEDTAAALIDKAARLRRSLEA